MNAPRRDAAIATEQAAEATDPGQALAKLEALATDPNVSRDTRRKAARAVTRAHKRAHRAELDEDLAGVDRATTRVRHLDARARRRTRR